MKSRNQECTFALIYGLIEDNEIDFEEELLNKISSLNVKDADEKTTIGVREQYQYGTELSIRDNLYIELFELAKEVSSKTKIIIEQ